MGTELTDEECLLIWHNLPDVLENVDPVWNTPNWCEAHEVLKFYVTPERFLELWTGCFIAASYTRWYERNKHCLPKKNALPSP